MIYLTKPIFFFSFIFVLCNNCNAQQKIDWAKYNSLSFKEDSVSPLIRDAMIKDGFIDPIRKSNAKIEFRMYSQLSTSKGWMFVYVIQITSDSCIAKEFFCNKGIFYPNTIFPDSLGKDEKGQYLQRKIWRGRKDIEPNEALSLLIKSNVFTIRDQQLLIDSLKNSKITINDPCEGANDCADIPNFCEVKFGNKFRSFMIRGIDYFPKNENLKIEAFENNHYLYQLISKLFYILY